MQLRFVLIAAHESPVSGSHDCQRTWRMDGLGAVVQRDVGFCATVADVTQCIIDALKRCSLSVHVIMPRGLLCQWGGGSQQLFLHIFAAVADDDAAGVACSGLTSQVVAAAFCGEAHNQAFSCVCPSCLKQNTPWPSHVISMGRGSALNEAGLLPDTNSGNLANSFRPALYIHKLG